MTSSPTPSRPPQVTRCRVWPSAFALGAIALAVAISPVAEAQDRRGPPPPDGKPQKISPAAQAAPAKAKNDAPPKQAPKAAPPAERRSETTAQAAARQADGALYSVTLEAAAPTRTFTSRSGHMAGITPRCEDRDDRAYRPLVDGNYVTFNEDVRAAESFCLILRRASEERCLPVFLPREHPFYHLITPDMFAVLGQCPPRRKFLVRFQSKTGAEIPLATIVRAAGSVKIGAHEVDGDSKAPLAARDALVALGHDAIEFDHKNAYRVLDVPKRGDEAPAAKEPQAVVVVEETFVRLGDIKVRPQNSAGDLERNCSASLDVPGERQINREAWQKALGAAVSVGGLDDRKRPKLFPPPPNTNIPSQQRAYVVEEGLRNLLVSTRDDMRPLALAASGDNPLCPKSSFEGVLTDQEFAARNVERKVRDAGMVVVGLVSLDPDLNKLPPADRTRAIQLLNDALDAIAASLQKSGKRIERLANFQRQVHPGGEGANRALTGDRTARTESLVTFLRDNAQSLTPIPLRQIREKVKEILVSEGLSPNHSDLAIVLVGLVHEGKRSACAEKADTLDPNAAAWFKTTGRLLVVELKPTRDKPASQPVYKPSSTVSEVARCVQDDQRFEALSIEIPAAVLPGIKENVLDEIANASRRLFVSMP
jgi:hypothetical protein